MIKLGYRIAENDEGDIMPVGKTTPRYYKYKVPDTVKIEPETLPEGEYTLEIVAENCYGMQSEPITAKL